MSADSETKTSWKAIFIEAEADVGALSEVIPEIVDGTGIVGQAARRMGCWVEGLGERIDWLSPARPGLKRSK